VTSRAAQGQNLFNDQEDYAMYLELLAKYKNQHGFKLFAFCLLATHLHLLVESTP
jgi:REP element-mobilizing transposase RayT